MPGLNPVVYRDKPLAGGPLDFTFWLSPAASGVPPLIRIRALPSSSDWQLPWPRPQRGCCEGPAPCHVSVAAGGLGVGWLLRALSLARTHGCGYTASCRRVLAPTPPLGLVTVQARPRFLAGTDCRAGLASHQSSWSCLTWLSGHWAPAPCWGALDPTPFSTQLPQRPNPTWGCWGPAP